MECNILVLVDCNSDPRRTTRGLFRLRLTPPQGLCCQTIETLLIVGQTRVSGSLSMFTEWRCCVLGTCDWLIGPLWVTVLSIDSQRQDAHDYKFHYSPRPRTSGIDIMFLQDGAVLNVRKASPKRVVQAFTTAIQDIKSTKTLRDLAVAFAKKMKEESASTDSD